MVSLYLGVLHRYFFFYLIFAITIFDTTFTENCCGNCWHFDWSLPCPCACFIAVQNLFFLFTSTQNVLAKPDTGSIFFHHSPWKKRPKKIITTSKSELLNVRDAEAKDIGRTSTKVSPGGIKPSTFLLRGCWWQNTCKRSCNNRV